MKPLFRLIVAGSRGFAGAVYEERSDPNFLASLQSAEALAEEFLDNCVTRVAQSHEIVVITGGARGADTIGNWWARKRGYHSVIMNADWRAYGKRAGFKRNREMAMYAIRPDHRPGAVPPEFGVAVFWDGRSPGTKHMLDAAREFSMPVKIQRFRRSTGVASVDPPQLQFGRWS